MNSDDLAIKRHEFLVALKSGVNGFVNYFSSSIPESLLRFQDRPTASMLLAEELTALKMPLFYLKSLINRGWLRYKYNTNRDAVTIEFTDQFFDDSIRS